MLEWDAGWEMMGWIYLSCALWQDCIDTTCSYHVCMHVVFCAAEQAFKTLVVPAPRLGFAGGLAGQGTLPPLFIQCSLACHYACPID